MDDLLNSDDLLVETQTLEPGTSAALVVGENLWAKGPADAVGASGGTLVDHGRVDPNLAEAAMALYLGAADRR